MDHKGNDFDRKTKDKVELKIERPHIKANVTELDWKIFEAKWARFEEAADMSEVVRVHQFWATMDKEIEYALIHKGLGLEKDFEILKEATKKLAIGSNNVVVNQVDFGALLQNLQKIALKASWEG